MTQTETEIPKFVRDAWPDRKDDGPERRYRGWFTNNYVKRHMLTSGRPALFNEFVGLKTKFGLHRDSLGYLKREWEDHSKIWRGGGCNRVFTTEPYGLNLEQTAAIVAAAREHGLDLHIGAESPHNTGATCIVILSVPEEAEA